MPMDREAVASASACNWCSFILLMFATASSYWTWGWATSPLGLSATLSTGPWLAGQAWSTYPIQCNCNPTTGYCYSWCYVGTKAADWALITAEEACGPQSSVYLEWAGPLGYCTFPPGFVPPESNCTIPDSTVKGCDILGGVPEGTTFNVPSQIPAIQGLMITSVILVFFASILGCADAGSEPGSRNKQVSLLAGVCSFLGWLFCLAAYCTWSGMEYVMRLQVNPPTIGIPLFDEGGILRAAVPLNANYGPGWSTALAASLITMYAMFVHCFAFKSSGPSTAFGSEAKFEAATGGGAAPAAEPAAAPANNTVPPPAQSNEVGIV